MMSPLKSLLVLASIVTAQSLQLHHHHHHHHNNQNRRSALISIASSTASILSLATLTVPSTASAEDSPTPKFQRYPQIRFIAALGDPSASSGTGAQNWGLWKDDPGPRGVYLRDYNRKLSSGKAPNGWTLDRDNIWIEEHGLIMPSPGPLPRKSYNRSTKETLDYKRFIVTGDREITTMLTVYDDGRWDLAKGSLYDVTHLPCRSAVYTPLEGAGGGSCMPTPADQGVFPVKPGMPMPYLKGGNCAKQDYAVLFVLGEEVL